MNGFPTSPLAALIAGANGSFESTSVSSYLGEDGKVHTKVRKNINGEITEDNYSEDAPKLTNTSSIPSRAKKEVCQTTGYPPADLIEDTKEGLYIAEILVAKMDTDRIEISYDDEEETIHVSYNPIEKQPVEGIIYKQKGIKNKPFEIAYKLDLKKYDPNTTDFAIDGGVLTITTGKNKNHVSSKVFKSIKADE